mmetsp:Transcript_20202/g.42433  ORF Transcript_20202/g.42433 Transcript_20202/m.42433 type:complete len:138 (-) Transcript_20202:395-808(-)
MAVFSTTKNSQIETWVGGGREVFPDILSNDCLFWPNFQPHSNRNHAEIGVDLWDCTLTIIAHEILDIAPCIFSLHLTLGRVFFTQSVFICATIMKNFPLRKITIQSMISLIFNPHQQDWHSLQSKMQSIPPPLMPPR